MEKKKIAAIIRAIFSVTFSIGCIIFVMWMICFRRNVYHETELSQGWTVTVNDQQVERQDDINDYRFENLKIGDKVVFSTNLPPFLTDNQSLSILAYLSTVQVKIGGEQVYFYGKENAKKNWMVGSGYHFVDIPKASRGHALTMTLEVREPNAFTNMPAPRIVETDAIYAKFAVTNLIGISVGMFLVILGGVLLVVSSVAAHFNRSFLRLFYIGGFSFLLGMWSMCNLKVLQIFGVDLSANTTMEYLTLYSAPIFITLMIGEIRKDAELWRRQVVQGAAILLLVFFMVTSILHFLNIEHYPRFLGYFHIFGVVIITIVSISAIDKNRKITSSALFLYIGIISLCMTLIADVIRFNLQKYFFPSNERLSFSIVPLGALAFVIFLIISYVLDIYGNMIDTAEKNWLKDRAYHDELCGTFNRTRCNELFEELSRGRKEYALVNIDLDGLKSINDRLGHSQGDELLKEFATILQNAFEGVGTIFRMGGDEFLVVVPEDKIEYLDGCVAKMEKLQKRRSNECVFNIESSYGISYSEECGRSNIEKIYTLADQRMYEMKTKRKINKRLR